MKQPDCLLDENTSVGLRGGSPAPTGRKLLAGRSRELLRGRWRGLLAWCAVLAGLLVLALVIRHTFLRRHAWFVPINYDQASYLAESYACYDRLQHQGLVEGIIEVASRHQPTGALMPWLSTILFAIFGPGRMTAVTLNLFFFFGLQLTLAFTLRWASGRWSTTLYGLGLLLSALTPYFWAGGIMDLRLDFIVFCVYGIFLCLVLRSGFFQSWRWSLAAGGVAGFLAGFRYITGVYLAGFLVICFAVTLVRWLLGCRHAERRRIALRQMGGVVLAGLVVMATGLPFFWRDFDQIWGYYVANHALGSEKEVRANEWGVNSRLDHLLFYVRSLAGDHSGLHFLSLVVLGILCSAALLLAMRLRRWRVPALPFHLPSACFMLSAGLIVPYAVLTTDISKSPVVGNIMVPPLLLLALLPVLRLSQLRHGPAVWYVVRTLTLLAAVGLVTGAAIQIRGNSGSPSWPPHREAAQEILAMHDKIARAIEARPGMQAHLCCNLCEDYIAPAVFTVHGYETDGKIITILQDMPVGVLGIDQKTVHWALERSEIVLLADKPGSEVYPFHTSMKQFTPEIREYCERYLVRIGHYRGLNCCFDVYERPVQPQQVSQRGLHR